MIEFERIEINNSLYLLSKDKQLAFFLILCERMLPYLIQFANDTKYNDLIYKRCLINAWCYLDGYRTIEDYVKFSTECLNNAPDTENFSHYLTSAALNTALSIGKMMEFLADHDVDHVVEAASLARDTVALFAQSDGAIPPHSLSFEEIIEHPLILQEYRQQSEDLKFLKALQTDSHQLMIPLIKEHAAQASAVLPGENPPPNIRPND